MSETSHCPICGAEFSGSTCPACLMKLALEHGTFVSASGERPTVQYTGGFTAPPVETLTAMFPQFELLELIGKGGMGAVYRARQKSLDRIVAVKIINPEAARQPGFAERFAREARAMARLNHSNIVTIHDFGETRAVDSTEPPGEIHHESLYYLVMEYVDGTNLRSVMRERQLTAAEALAIVPHLCDALQYAHEEGIVHRDIKPENILIDAKGRVKIADFGLAKLVGQAPREITLTEAHQALGTLHYMAPEQFDRPLEVDHRVDIYALGVTFYEMLTGELPIGRFPLPSEKVHVDVRLDEIVLRTLEREPSRRYQHASDVKTDVQSFATNAPQRAVPADTACTYPPGTAPQMLIVTLGYAAASLLIAIGIGLLSYAAVSYSADSAERWSWYCGGGIGAFVGGLAGLLACASHVRAMRGKPDWMQEAHWNLYDVLMLAYGTLGVSGLAATFICWSAIDFWPRIAALIFAAVAAAQGIGISFWRAAMRRAATRNSLRPALGLQMILVAVSLTACALLIVGGLGLLIYSAISLPPGSIKLWAGIGCALIWIFGGGSGLLVTWNLYRTLEGLPSWMTDDKLNALDWTMISTILVGACLALAGPLAAPWVSATSVAALSIIGAIVGAIAGLSLGIRALLRRAAQQVAARDSL